MLFRETKMFNGAKQSSEHIAIGIYLLFVMGAMRTPHVYFYVTLSFALIACLHPIGKDLVIVNFFLITTQIIFNLYLIRTILKSHFVYRILLTLVDIWLLLQHQASYLLTCDVQNYLLPPETFLKILAVLLNVTFWKPFSFFHHCIWNQK